MCEFQPVFLLLKTYREEERLDFEYRDSQIGGSRRIRTFDTLIKSQVLYLLSYGPNTVNSTNT